MTKTNNRKNIRILSATIIIAMFTLNIASSLYTLTLDNYVPKSSAITYSKMTNKEEYIYISNERNDNRLSISTSLYIDTSTATAQSINTFVLSYISLSGVTMLTKNGKQSAITALINNGINSTTKSQSTVSYGGIGSGFNPAPSLYSDYYIINNTNTHPFKFYDNTNAIDIQINGSCASDYGSIIGTSYLNNAINLRYSLKPAFNIVSNYTFTSNLQYKIYSFWLNDTGTYSEGYRVFNGYENIVLDHPMYKLQLIDANTNIVLHADINFVNFSLVRDIQINSTKIINNYDKQIEVNIKNGVNFKDGNVWQTGEEINVGARNGRSIASLYSRNIHYPNGILLKNVIEHVNYPGTLNGEWIMTTKLVENSFEFYFSVPNITAGYKYTAENFYPGPYGTFYEVGIINGEFYVVDLSGTHTVPTSVIEPRTNFMHHLRLFCNNTDHTFKLWIDTIYLGNFDVIANTLNIGPDSHRFTPYGTNYGDSYYIDAFDSNSSSGYYINRNFEIDTSANILNNHIYADWEHGHYQTNTQPSDVFGINIDQTDENYMPSLWTTSLGSGISVNSYVINEYDGHKKILMLKRNSGTNNATLVPNIDMFGGASNTWYGMWVKFDGVTTGNTFRVNLTLQTGDTWNFLTLDSVNGLVLKNKASTTTSVLPFTTDWFHISFYAMLYPSSCAQQIYINNRYIGEFISSISSSTTFKTISYTISGSNNPVSMYVDAVCGGNDSSDSFYENTTYNRYDFSFDSSYVINSYNNILINSYNTYPNIYQINHTDNSRSIISYASSDLIQYSPIIRYIPISLQNKAYGSAIAFNKFIVRVNNVKMSEPFFYAFIGDSYNISIYDIEDNFVGDLIVNINIYTTDVTVEIDYLLINNYSNEYIRVRLIPGSNNTNSIPFAHQGYESFNTWPINKYPIEGTIEKVAGTYPNIYTRYLVSDGYSYSTVQHKVMYINGNNVNWTYPFPTGYTNNGTIETLVCSPDDGSNYAILLQNINGETFINITSYFNDTDSWTYYNFTTDVGTVNFPGRGYNNYWHYLEINWANGKANVSINGVNMIINQNVQNNAIIPSNIKFNVEHEDYNNRPSSLCIDVIDFNWTNGYYKNRIYQYNTGAEMFTFNSLPSTTQMDYPVFTYDDYSIDLNYWNGTKPIFTEHSRSESLSDVLEFAACVAGTCNANITVPTYDNFMAFNFIIEENLMIPNITIGDGTNTNIVLDFSLGNNKVIVTDATGTSIVDFYYGGLTFFGLSINKNGEWKLYYWAMDGAYPEAYTGLVGNFDSNVVSFYWNSTHGTESWYLLAFATSEYGLSIAPWMVEDFYRYVEDVYKYSDKSVLNYYYLNGENPISTGLNSAYISTYTLDYYWYMIYDYYDNFIEGGFLMNNESVITYVTPYERECFVSLADQQGNYIDWENYIIRVDGSIVYSNYFLKTLDTTFNVSIYTRFGAYLGSAMHTVNRINNFIPISINIYSLKIFNQQTAFIHYNITKDPNYYPDSTVFWSEWLAPNEISNIKLTPDKYKLTIMNNETGTPQYVMYSLSFTTDDVLLISSSNTIFAVLQNINNLKSDIDTQFNYVQLNFTNVDSRIGNQTTIIEINFANQNTTFETMLLSQQNSFEFINSTLDNMAMFMETNFTSINSSIDSLYALSQNSFVFVNSTMLNMAVEQTNTMQFINNSIESLAFISSNSFEYLNNSIENSITYMSQNFSFINTTMNQNQLDLMTEFSIVQSDIDEMNVTMEQYLGVMNSSIANLTAALNSYMFLVNNSIYTAVLESTSALYLQNNQILGNLSITYKQNEYLTQILQETLFSKLLSWEGVNYNYSIIEEQIETYTFVNQFRDQATQVELKYKEQIETITLAATESLEQIMPKEDVEYRVKSVATGEYLTEWTSVDNTTVDVGFYAEPVPEYPPVIETTIADYLQVSLLGIGSASLLAVLYIRGRAISAVTGSVKLSSKRRTLKW